MIGWDIFLVSAGVALAIAVLTVSYQSIKAALANPADSLRGMNKEMDQRVGFLEAEWIEFRRSMRSILS